MYKMIRDIQSANADRFYIAGAGKYGEILGRYFDKRGISWKGYVDKKAPLLQRINGKKVYAYEDVNINESYFVISTFSYREEITEVLRNKGVAPERIISYENQEQFYEVYEDLVHWSKYTDRMRHFYRKYEGRRCFIIGNGPSLRIEDLEKLKAEITFASNSIYALYEFTDWRPVYYCAWDAVFCEEMMSEEENMHLLMDGCEAAFTSILGEGIQYRDNADMSRLYYMCTLYDGLGDGNLPFSENCDKHVYMGGNITYGMLQMAVYMGFTKIYLLGMDFSYSVERYGDGTIVQNDICNHMKEIEEEEKRFYKPVSKRHGMSYVADVDLQLAGYQAAKKYADAHDIEIYNATRGGKLEVFPRVDFDSLFD